MYNVFRRRLMQKIQHLGSERLMCGGFELRETKRRRNIGEELIMEEKGMKPLVFSRILLNGNRQQITGPGVRINMQAVQEIPH